MLAEQREKEAETVARAFALQTENGRLKADLEDLAQSLAAIKFKVRSATRAHAPRAIVARRRGALQYAECEMQREDLAATWALVNIDAAERGVGVEL